MLKHLKKKVLYMKHNYFYPALSELKGKILEIGFGDGESLNHYHSNCEIFALEKLDKKIQQLKNNNAKYLNVKFFKGKAESFPFENDFFDAVVVSMVLCSVESIKKAIEEIERVLKPGGKLIFLEHISSENRVIKMFQDILAKPHALIDNNCHLNRNPIININKEIVDISLETLIPYFLGTKLAFGKAYKKL